MTGLIPEYRYLIANVVDGSVVMEVPFGGVSWERKISGAGAFSGSISADPNQDHFDLYNTTIPGKHAIYVMRDGVCVWGGIIWSRDYDIIDRNLSVSALEFSSYFHHRLFWKTMALTGPTIKDMLTQLVTAVFNDQSSVNEPLAYSASDVHNLINFYKQDNGSGSAGNRVTITTEENHNFIDDDSVYIDGFTGAGTGYGQTYFNGTYTVKKVNNNTFYYTVGGSATFTNTTATNAGLGVYAIKSSSKTTIDSSVAINMSLSLETAVVDVSTGLDSYTIVPGGANENDPYTFRGTEMRYVGEIIDNFSSNGVQSYLTSDPNQSIVSTRFDYFVESTLDGATGKFKNTFKAWLVRKDNNQYKTQPTSTVDYSALYGPSKLAASNIVFEHPGNIVSMSLAENADSAASRLWMVDSGNDLNNTAEPYYGSYTNLTYLGNGYPILETAITDRNLDVNNDKQVAPYAKSVGYRLAPPIGTYSVQVNGSLSPEIGVYKPGDWCVVIPNDSFINKRLMPPYENRTGVLVRKILSVKVSVPDNPTFPETVDLELVPEWEVSDA
jgi:hypothetical protein